MDKQNLFGEFPPISTKDWKNKIEIDLKGADYNKRLVWRNAENFEVQPFYRAEDIDKLESIAVSPGDFPFLRGNKIKGNGWLIRQDMKVENFETANAKALDIHLKGVDSLGFIFSDDYKPTTTDIDRLLQNIHVDIMELNFSNNFPLETIQIIKDLAKRYDRDPEKIHGSVDFDPLNYYSLNRKFRTEKEGEFAVLDQILQASKHLPNFHPITVDGSLFLNSGSGIVTQLAFTLAKGVEYLNYLTGKGFDIDNITPKMRFHFAVGSSYFMEIAKFRAVKYLWSNIVNAYGLKDTSRAAMFIHCSSSEWNKTVYDPYVNMLRTTTETMSATIGGINSMTVLPFDKFNNSTSTKLGERIARNQQLLLKNESYFDKVADPAAGSYYVEELTKMIIESAWKLFLEVDERGGYLKAFETGFIQEKINEEAKQKDLDIAIRKRTLLGTNQYPNTGEFHEKFISFAPVTDQQILNPYRGAQVFEELRQKTDKFALKNPRPKVWMFTFGNLAMRNARAQFAANFFGCAGFEIINNDGFGSIEKGIEAARKSKGDIVVICSSDDEYKDNVLQIYKALKNEKILVLAGYPKDQVGNLQSNGFNHFIHVKSNVLEELEKYQELLGIS
jgi:methylmalonyl-CoA mutase